ncbi:protein kinase domain-containing protein [Kitasatospora purpeofusca]|uniref:protein kinase domain-containing protein n=1 Tax=Kitasatospora purpeofusca TaxID=67352 RepID=UPI002256F0A7|nr:protein kinase [Kitasatospora purpeofusca]MCX4754060.1 protein kinase [Kitasatospora purpeofusca]WSR33509.1 protein kinase [Kitasatospora purpeofusca]WSR41592.1 protein kinase [Kitasatospora purpeofusca]
MSEHGNAAAEGYSLGNGRYVLQRVLGEGGMASVHLAYDSVLDRQVALKSMHAELGRDDSFKERFRREAQAVARLEHPNIVTVYDSGEDIAQDGSSTPYIVMQLIDGKGLRDAINEAVGQHGAMPVEEALRVTIGVLNALEASHDMGLVHRDIKPGNVMFDRKGNVKVMDFGIARALESGVTSMTQTGMVVGTPQYLSPEQALGKPVDARSDLYSVGVMLFEMITGQLVFDGDSAFSIAYKHVQEEPPAPSTLNPRLAPAVDGFVATALRKDPAHRFPSAAAMRDEAERLIAAGKGGGSPLAASNPLVITDGPRSVHAAPQTPQPFVQPQPFQPQPFAQPQPFQTPPPAFQAPHTPHPFPQPQPFQTPPAFQAPHTPHPFPQQAHTPPPHPMPAPPFQPQPVPASNSGGCSTALVIIGIIVGVIVLAVIIIAIVVNRAEDTTKSGSTRGVSGAAVTVLRLDGQADRNGLL